VPAGTSWDVARVSLEEDAVALLADASTDGHLTRVIRPVHHTGSVIFDGERMVALLGMN
jgi:hypothetical protein